MGGLLREVRFGRAVQNPNKEELRRLMAKEERTTEYGSPAYITSVRNRSAKNTYVVNGVQPLGVMQRPIPADQARALQQKVNEYLAGEEVVVLDRVMGTTPPAVFSCRVYVTSRFARIPFMWHETLFDPVDRQIPASDPTPFDFVTVIVPEWPERIIIVDPGSFITYVLGTDYFGECKKSFLRMAMLAAKNRGWLGFHAGSKILRLSVNGGLNGELDEKGVLLFGLSGTGKTTLTVHDHSLRTPEAAIIRQDDVVLMDERGYCYGTENGFFFKTEGLEPSQTVLWNAATHPEAILENVAVKDGGIVDFSDTTLTSNGRGVVKRVFVDHVDDKIDLEKANMIVFITRRNDIIPAVAKLNPIQAAAFFMLGESIETSAGDPTRAGQSKREVGTNPFIIGPESLEGNRLKQIMEKVSGIECFILNTGSVGASQNSAGRKIRVSESAQILREIAAGNVRWHEDPDWGYMVPEEIRGVEPVLFEPGRFYSAEEYASLSNHLRNERVAWLNKFPGLDPEIAGLFNP